MVLGLFRCCFTVLIHPFEDRGLFVRQQLFVVGDFQASVFVYLPLISLSLTPGR